MHVVPVQVIPVAKATLVIDSRGIILMGEYHGSKLYRSRAYRGGKA